MVLSVNHPAIGYNKETMTFSCEVSDLEERHQVTESCWSGNPIFIRNEKTKVQIKMTRFKVDKDSSNEDTYGWWYHGSINGKHIKFLFIND